MSKQLIFLLFCAIVVYSVGSVECCSCEWMSSEQHYCVSDFVVLTIAKNKSESNGSTVYDIDLWRKYRSKNDGTDEALMTKQLWTRSLGSSCGVALRLGEPYIVSGYVVDSKPRISVCNYIQLLTDITVEEEIGLIREYKENCNRN